MSFERDRFLSDCQQAVVGTSPSLACRELVQRAVSTPAEALAGLGEPTQGGVQPLLVSDTLTVLNVVWAPRMTLMPHDHNMWAVIGVYSGREDNIFWKRREGSGGESIEAAAAKSLGPGEVCPLGRDIVHSVTNPTSRFTGAIHVYGGDFFANERSEWDPETLRERPYDVEKNMALFAEANAQWGPSENAG